MPRESRCCTWLTGRGGIDGAGLRPGERPVTPENGGGMQPGECEVIDDGQVEHASSGVAD